MKSSIRKLRSSLCGRFWDVPQEMEETGAMVSGMCLRKSAGSSSSCFCWWPPDFVICHVIELIVPRGKGGCNICPASATVTDSTQIGSTETWEININQNHQGLVFQLRQSPLNWRMLLGPQSFSWKATLYHQVASFILCQFSNYFFFIRRKISRILVQRSFCCTHKVSYPTQTCILETCFFPVLAPNHSLKVMFNSSFWIITSCRFPIHTAH